ncbi:bifunctional diguanylate cyclase/phosphodiesterase [Methylogaea oryzae]|nr:EAL domain-containing protein [Methylogaea oryzae]
MDKSMQSARFLSLKWSALLLTSLVLIAVTGAYAFYSSYELHKLFQERREQVKNQNARQVQGLLEQSAKRLQQLGMTVAALPTVQRSLSATPPAQPGEDSRAARDLEGILSILDLDLGIQTAAIFTDSPTPIAANGWRQNARLSSAVELARTQETPISVHQCDQGCTQYAAVPILGHSRNIGVVVLGVSPADLILEFQGVSGSDIGLLVLDNAERSETDPSRWVAPWQAAIVALSNAEANAPLLRQLAASFPTPDSLDRSTIVQRAQRSYEIHLVRLKQFEPGSQAYLVFIADISDELEQIEIATRRTVLLGLAGLVVSESLLLAILWTPMSRLRRAADTLPMLAEAAYDQVRATIAHKRGRRWTRDEVDVLDDTAIALSHQLETLNQQVVDKTQDLSDRMRELAKEKRFVTHILDAAQALVMTHDRQHNVLMANRYCETITGYSAAELQGQPLTGLLAQELLRPAVTRELDRLTAQRIDHLEEEWDIRCKDGSTLNIVWHHSVLTDQDSGEPITLSIGMDITARKNAELRLAWLADHDPLTRLYNRRRFQEELKDALAAGKRYNHGGALLFFDLDQFKYVNDTSGHRAGDQLLERLGEMLPPLLGETDVLGRIGGDEFAVILPHADAEAAVAVARSLLAHIGGTEFLLSGRVYKISASIGIALFPQDGNNVGDLMARADIAMYQVKDTGRGGWHLFSQNDESHRLIQERFLWKERIEKALAEQRFLLYVQPIVKIPEGHASHYEVLLRMKGEDGSVIGPAQFIEVAERSGLIHAIDRMVLSSAIRYLAMLENRGISVTFAINLSAHAFNNPELLNHLSGLLQETKVNPRQVILEMTETAAIGDLNAAKSLLTSIQELGCRFALDDFGAGFSSFYYMRELPMEFVKIDGAFIRKLAENPDDQALVVAMSQIARAFGKTTIAEQVENAETLRLLEQFGIDYSQGYFTGKPAPVENVFGIEA